MTRRPFVLAQAAPSAPTAGPRWVPIKEDWTWIAGTATVAALAAGLIYMGSRKK